MLDISLIDQVDQSVTQTVLLSKCPYGRSDQLDILRFVVWPDEWDRYQV